MRCGLSLKYFDDLYSQKWQRFLSCKFTFYSINFLYPVVIFRQRSSISLMHYFNRYAYTYTGRPRKRSLPYCFYDKMNKVSFTNKMEMQTLSKQSFGIKRRWTGMWRLKGRCIILQYLISIF